MLWAKPAKEVPQSHVSRTVDKQQTACDEHHVEITERGRLILLQQNSTVSVGAWPFREGTRAKRAGKDIDQGFVVIYDPRVGISHRDRYRARGARSDGLAADIRQTWGSCVRTHGFWKMTDEELSLVEYVRELQLCTFGGAVSVSVTLYKVRD